MPLLTRLLFGEDRIERPRRPLSTMLDPSWATARSDAGISVSEEKALHVAAVWRAVNLIAGSAASMPLKTYEDGTRERAAVGVLTDPHPEMTSFEFWEVVWFSLLLWGNSYSQKIRNAQGEIVELWPIPPALVQVGRVEASASIPTGKLFKVSDSNGEDHVLTSDDILHIPGPGYDGVCGVSPIRLWRQGLGLALAAEEYGARLFGSGSLMAGILQSEQRLTEEQATALKARWQAKIGGLTKAHEVAVLDSGAKFQSIGINPDDAQFIESRRFQVSEVARYFGVPPHLLFDVERTTSWGSGVEQQSIGFVVYTMRPWLTRVEQRVTKELTPPGVYAEYTVEGLLRGDSASRAAFYRTMSEIRAMNPNEIRVRENLEPYEGGDVYANPNITPTTTDKPTLEEDEVRSLMGRLSWQASLDDVDVGQLVAGMNGKSPLVLDAFREASAAGEDVPRFRERLRALGSKE